MAEKQEINGVALAIAGWLMAALAQAQVYKCPDSAGKTVYQDSPCPGGREVARATPGEGGADVQAIRAGMARGKVVAGMSPTQVRYLMGEPNSVHANTGGETWFYSPEGWSMMVSFRAGKVDWVSQRQDNRVAIERRAEEDKARERRYQAMRRSFLSVGMREAEVFDKVGQPDSRASDVIRLAEGDRELPRHVEKLTYSATDGDQKTTEVWVRDGRVVKIARE